MQFAVNSGIRFVRFLAVSRSVDRRHDKPERNSAPPTSPRAPFQAAHAIILNAKSVRMGKL